MMSGELLPTDSGSDHQFFILFSWKNVIFRQDRDVIQKWEPDTNSAERLGSVIRRVALDIRQSLSLVELEMKFFYEIS
jgi:hypothetical protein